MSTRFMATLASLVLVAGCAEVSTMQPVDAKAEVSRLQSLGFSTVTTTQDGTQVLSYSGPITEAVVCQRLGGAFGPLEPTRQTRSGETAETTLDAYLQLRPGSDGVLAPAERSGVYAVTTVFKKRDGSNTRGLDRITFAPGESATTQSGLTCRAS